MTMMMMMMMMMMMVDEDDYCYPLHHLIALFDRLMLMEWS